MRDAGEGEPSSRDPRPPARPPARSTARPPARSPSAEQGTVAGRVRYDVLVQHAPDAIVLVDGRGILQFISPAGELLFGVSNDSDDAESNVGRHFLELVDPAHRDEAIVEFADLLVTAGISKPRRVHARRADGSVRIIEAVANNRLDDPSVRGLVITLRDVTDQQEVVAAITSAENRMRHMLENISDTVTLVDREANVLLTTGNFKSIMGYDRAFWEGRNGFDVLHPDDREWTRMAMLRLLESPGVELSGEVRTKVADGSWIDVEINAVNLLDDADVQAIVITTRNVTERKRAERVLAEARDEAIQALRMRTEFIANVSHELRTPIHGILGLSELLASADLDEDSRGLARSIGRATESLRMVLDDVLDFAKIEVGRLDIATIPVNVIEMADDVFGLFSTQAQAKGIELTRSLEPGFPQTIVVDPLRVRQVLHNLIGNAVKFTDEGGVHVELGRAPEGQPGDQPRLRLTVRDTGIGIPAEAHDRLFQPFSQLHIGTVRALGGTGLGLSIAKRLVELMCGELHVESVMGEGSTFWFDLPLIESRAGATPDATSEQPARASVGTSGRVLVVEDNPINQLLVRRQLDRLGYEPIVVDSGLVAVEMFPDVAAEVVLMDWQLPGIDGLETTRRLRFWEAENERDRTPIIAMTASALPGDRERCLASGMDDFIAKPVSIHTLGEVLARWVATARLPSALPGGADSAPRPMGDEPLVAATADADGVGQPVDPAVASDDPPASVPGPGPTEGPAESLVGSGDDEVAATLERLLDELSDPHLVETVVRTYLRELPVRLAGLREAVDNRDMAALVAAAHLLRSTSGAVGASALAELCGAVETDARMGGEPPRDLAPIEAAAAAAAGALREEIARLSECSP